MERASDFYVPDDGSDEPGDSGQGFNPTGDYSRLEWAARRRDRYGRFDHLRPHDPRPPQPPGLFD